jgi:SAM-dependent methyltransferase
LLGDSRSIPDTQVDLAVMTGNVAQHIPDPQWQQTLAALRRVVRPGGVVAFETRNPAHRGWESWVAQEPTTRPTAHGTLTEWLDGGETAPGTVTLAAHTVFGNTGEHVLEPFTLTFRDRDTLQAELLAAGFAADEIWCDWQRSPFLGHEPLMVVEARHR